MNKMLDIMKTKDFTESGTLNKATLAGERTYYYSTGSEKTRDTGSPLSSVIHFYVDLAYSICGGFKSSSPTIHICNKMFEKKQEKIICYLLGVDDE